MKRFIVAVGGVCAAVVGALVWGSKTTPRINRAAHTSDPVEQFEELDQPKKQS